MDWDIQIVIELRKISIGCNRDIRSLTPTNLELLSLTTLYYKLLLQEYKLVQFGELHHAVV